METRIVAVALPSPTCTLVGEPFAKNVAADPWSAKKRKEESGQRIDKMSFLPCMSFLRKQESRKKELKMTE